MRLPIHVLPRSINADHRASASVDNCPTPTEVVSEIGMLLLIHLAVTFAIVVSLRLFGFA